LRVMGPPPEHRRDEFEEFMSPGMEKLPEFRARAQGRPPMALDPSRLTVNEEILRRLSLPALVGFGEAFAKVAKKAGLVDRRAAAYTVAIRRAIVREQLRRLVGDEHLEEAWDAGEAAAELAGLDDPTAN
jgi:hypothetical protein